MFRGSPLSFQPASSISVRITLLDGPARLAGITSLWSRAVDAILATAALGQSEVLPQRGADRYGHRTVTEGTVPMTGDVLGTTLKGPTLFALLEGQNSRKFLNLRFRPWAMLQGHRRGGHRPNDR